MNRLSAPEQDRRLIDNLSYLKLPEALQTYPELAREAAQQHWSHIEFLDRLVELQANAQRTRSVERRIRLARFPVLKTLEQFDWNWPKEINRIQVENLFHLEFLKTHTNVIFIAGVGLGKTHLATALGHAACFEGHSVLFANAIDIINTLTAAKGAATLKQEIKRYLQPRLLVIDELGYLPIDKLGADLLFQVITQRYESGSIALTTNRLFRKWSEIFNNDSMITSAVLDRLLHHAEVVTIKGKSYRAKDRIEEAA